MKRKNIVLVLTTITVMLLSYLTGYDACEEHYKRYYDDVEIMLDGINENDMLDVIMESNEYQEYLKAKEEL